MAKKMSKLKTEELTAELKLTKDIEDYLDFDELAPVSLAEYINALVENKKTKLSIVARKAHMSSSYLYKLSEGKRKSPTRNKALQICFGLGLDIDESNEFLKTAVWGFFILNLVVTVLLCFVWKRGGGLLSVKNCSKNTMSHQL